MDWSKYFYIKDWVLYKKAKAIGSCPYGRELSYNSKYADKPAGTVDKDGYVCVAIYTDGFGNERNGCGKAFKAHRIIWEMINGPLDDSLSIDHIDGCKSNNNISNLRAVPHSTNMKNMSMKKSNKTRYTGVWYDKQRDKFQSYITYNGVRVRLGRFDTAEQAHKAREEYRLKKNLIEFTERHGK